MKDALFINFSDADQAWRFARHIATLKGVHRVELTKVRDQRSLAQNSYYRGVVCPYVAKGLRDAWGEDIDSAGAHEFLKAHFLKVPVSNKRTGEVMGYRVRSTTELDKAEFAAYLDEVFVFAVEQLRVEIPQASRFHGTEAA